MNLVNKFRKLLPIVLAMSVFMSSNVLTVAAVVADIKKAAGQLDLMALILDDPNAAKSAGKFIETAAEANRSENRANYGEGLTEDELYQVLLSADNYSNLSSEQKNILRLKSGFSHEQFSDCERAGLNIYRSMENIPFMQNYGLSAGEALQLRYTDNKISIEFLRFDDYCKRNEISTSDAARLLSFSDNGLSLIEVIEKDSAAQKLNVDIQDLIDKSFNKVLSSQKTNNIAEAAKKHNLSEEFVSDYIEKNNLSLEQFNDLLEPEIQQAQSAANSQNQLVGLKQYSEAPFVMNQNQTDSVNLLTGDLIYESVDAVVPGRNGMDVRIVTRYNSRYANTADIDRMQDYNGSEFDVLYNSNTIKNNIGTGWEFVFRWAWYQ